MSAVKTVEATESVATLVARLKDEGYVEVSDANIRNAYTYNGEQDLIHLLTSANGHSTVKITFEYDGYFVEMRWGSRQCSHAVGWNEFSTAEDVEGVLEELEIDSPSSLES